MLKKLLILAIAAVAAKIIFDKVVRVSQLAYETGRRVANLDHAPVRDNKGPRVGRTVKGKIVSTEK